MIACPQDGHTDSQDCSHKQGDHLFCSEDRSLRIIDIPFSIALSQYLEFDGQPIREIFSISPPAEPYASTEPKSKQARDNLINRVDPDTLKRNQQNANFVLEGLDRIKKSYTGAWLNTRILDSSITEIEQSDFKDSGSHADIPLKSSRGSAVSRRSKLQRPLDLSQIGRIPLDSTDLYQRLVYNPNDFPAQVTITGEVTANLRLPARSAFHNSKITRSSADHFLESIRTLYPEPSATAPPGQFDIILMDPPWTNRSVARGQQYALLGAKKHDQDALSVIDTILSEILAPEGVLAIWITNKALVRQRALEIFEDNGVEMIEEWTWLKVTSTGEPVLPVEGLYRQPWETCLIGRRYAQDDDANNEISRKLIVACPELHSRKPWIGGMLAEAYGKQQHHELRKLEIFARCTAAGWCAWGEETTKFNDCRWWQQNG